MSVYIAAVLLSVGHGVIEGNHLIILNAALIGEWLLMGGVILAGITQRKKQYHNK